MSTRHIKIVFSALLLFLFSAGLSVMAQETSGISVTCDSGGSFDNGVEVQVIQMRAGFTYTATAIGIDGFDPVLAVLDANGQGLCTDNSSDASSYEVNLPTTGAVSASRNSSQISFNQTSGQNMADVSIIVGSETNEVGEFVVILEGMAATSADGTGDPFSVRLTPGMVNSGVPLTFYMISVTNALDPFMSRIDADRNPIEDANGDLVACDDAGNASLCWGESSSLANSFVTRRGNQRLGGFGADAMISIPLDGVELDPDPDSRFLNYLMTSYQQSTFGDYLVAIHAGIGTVSGVQATSPDSGNQNQTQSTPMPTLPPKDALPSDVPAGISVTCDTGGSFDNGVEVQVVQMRAGFTYTATAIGINGFDPVLAILDANGQGICTDDVASAANYSVNLPTTGLVSASSTSSQISFNQTSGQNMADVSIIVGGYGNASGEFVLVLQGMAFTNADGGGDPFSVRMTPGMINSGVPLSVYMVSVTNSLDPYLSYVDADLTTILDTGNNPVYCDDAGNSSLCWGQSTNLTGSFIDRTAGQRIGGFDADAMLSIPLETYGLNSNIDLNFLNFLMSSYQRSTFGDYLVAFHIGN